MNKISISNLESVRQNPAAFIKSIKDGASSQPRFSKYMTWQLSLYSFHKLGDITSAENYFHQTFRRNFVESTANNRELDYYLNLLRSYSIEFERKNLTYIESKIRVEIPMNNEFKVTGEIPIVCMNNDFGYSAFFLWREKKLWYPELRFPLIQKYIAEKLYGVNLHEVEVGVFDITTGEIALTKYDSDYIESSVAELSELGDKLVSLI